MFNVLKELEALGNEVAPFSVRYARNEPTPYEDYFVSPIGSENDVYFEQQRKDLKTTFRTIDRLFYSKEAALAMERIVSDFRPDIAYVLHYLRKLSPSPLVALKKAKVPIVVRLSDFGMLCPQAHCLRDGQACTLCTKGNLLYSILHHCVVNNFKASILNAFADSFHRIRGYFNLIDAFVVTNPFMERLMEEAGYKKEKIHCIPTFTDTETFTPQEMSTKRTHILYSGRLEELKGVHFIIDAFSIMKNEIGDMAPPP